MSVIADLRRINALDGLLVVAIVLTSASFVRFVGVGPSPTRTGFLAYLLIAVAGVVLVRRRRVEGVTTWLALALLLMAFIGYLAWIPSHGSWIALNLWSEWILSFAFLLFGLVFGSSRWHVWRSLFIVLGLTVAVVQVVGLLWFQSLLSSRHGQWGPADFYGSRAVHANLVMLMVVGMVCVLLHPKLTACTRVLLAGVLGGSVMVSQWRTAWLAMFVALVIITVQVLRERRPRGAGWATITVGVLAAALVGLPAITGVSLLPGSSVTSVGSVALPSSATSSQTLTWRVDMWQSRLHADRPADGVVSGGVLGSDNVMFPGTGIMNGSMSAHNVFIDLYVAMGVCGLGLVLALVVAALIRRGLHQDDVGVSLIAGLVFGLSFFWPPWLWAVLGVALCAVPRRQQVAGAPRPDLVGA